MMNPICRAEWAIIAVRTAIVITIHRAAVIRHVHRGITALRPGCAKSFSQGIRVDCDDIGMLFNPIGM